MLVLTIYSSCFLYFAHIGYIHDTLLFVLYNVDFILASLYRFFSCTFLYQLTYTAPLLGIRIKINFFS